MDPSHQLAFGQNADAHNAAWNQRPALEMVGSDELKNLERVLMMNWSTMQQPQPTQPQPQQQQPQPQPQPPTSLSDSLQLNPYLLQMMQVQAAQQQSSVQTIPVHQSPPQPRHAAQRSANGGASNDQQQQAFQPVIQYPFVPFWTACPLPFSPLAYPQIIMPPSAMAPQQIGPQLLRPINWQQMPMPNFQAPHQRSQPPTPQSTSTASSTPLHTPLLPQSTPGTPAYPMMGGSEKKSEYEEKLERYREKRMKRKWSRMPDQRLSQAAQNRSRDENGKFTCDDKVAVISSYEASQKADYLQKQLDELKEQLSRSQFESKLLREKLVHTERELGVLRSNQPTPKAIPDDMYQRQVVAHAQMPQACQGDLFACAEDGIIYSPFKGGNAILAPFKEKVDFSQKKQDLRPINSPFLQVGKDTFLSSIFDTSRMDMRGSGEGSDGEREYEDQERRLGNDTKSLDKTSPPLSIPIYPFLLDGPLPTPQRHPSNKQP
jgi:hypothetical protein